METTPAIEPNPLYVAGARTVVIEEPRPEKGRPDQGSRPEEGRGDPGQEGQGRSRGSDDQDQGNRGQGQDRADQQNGRQGRRGGQGQSQDRGDRRDRPQPQQQPSTMKILLISAGTALLCGVIGAMDYSYFFGSNSERIDQMSRASDDSHAVQLAVQHELGELNRKVNDLAPLAGRFRRHEEQFDKFREESKVVRAQVDAMQVGRPAAGAVHRPGTSGSSPPGSAEASISRAMKEGIDLLGRGQYAEARLIFVRLQVAQPDDARV